MDHPDSATDSLATSPSLLSRLRDPQNHASWQHFIHRYRPLLRGVARKAGLDTATAEDVLQETLIEVAKQMPAFRYDPARGTFKGWLLTIVRRRIANHWRASTYQHGTERIPRSQALDPQAIDDRPAPGIDFDDLWESEWREHALAAALDLIKPDVKPLQFQAFTLHVVKGIPATDTARKLGIKLMEIYWAKYRVGKLLRTALGQLEREG